MLEEYRRRRDFARTAEPAPEAPSGPAGRAGPLVFVVQQHAARRLHYDVRLELDGGLKSWPVPKAPAYDPTRKRLAVMTEDHPLAYATFEGVIPAGEYGAGEMIVWDAGAYTTLEGDEPPDFHDRAAAERRLRAGIERGRFTVFLAGRKLRGAWTFARTRSDGRDQWLCLKRRDAFADPAREVVGEDRSVLSGLTLADLRAGIRPAPVPLDRLRPTAAGRPGARRAPVPKTLAPMLPSLTGRVFAHPDWLFEPKLDGYRVLALLRNGVVRLLSRNGTDLTADFPEIVADLRRQHASTAALDGEIVALDAEGRPSFQALQHRSAGQGADPAFYAFDLLHLDGWDTRALPLQDRKALLRDVLLPLGRVRYVDHFDDGPALFAAAAEHGLEGVVAKRRDAPYRSGKRVSTWLKIKHTRGDEFVVGGYTAGVGARADALGALLLGTPGADGRLRYAGHVGSGLGRDTLADLLPRLRALAADASPFDGPLPAAGRWQPRGRGRVTWVRPELVVEVKFAERTRDGLLRQPVFLRLREDKRPDQVVPALVVAPSVGNAAPGPEDPIEAALAQLAAAGAATTLVLDGVEVALTGLDKPLWPAHAGTRALTKRDLVAYYLRVAPVLLPHLRDRPLTVVRCPDGIAGQRFFQKRPTHAPPFVETVRAFSEQRGADGTYLVCNNLPTLVWLAQLAAVELHAAQTRTTPGPDGHQLPASFAGSLAALEASLLNHPDYLVVDLDPYLYSGHEAPGTEPELFPEGFARAREVAHHFRELLAGLGLACFPKTTGKTGLHLYVPIRRTLDHAGVHAVARTLAEFVERAHPRLATTAWAVKKRTGRVFLDHNMNGRGKTLAAAYSPRAVPWAGVSMPLTWEELDHAYPADFTLLTAPDRAAAQGDRWAAILDHKRDLRELLAGGSTAHAA